MRIPTDRGPLALKKLLVVQFKWIKIKVPCEITTEEVSEFEGSRSQT